MDRGPAWEGGKGGGKPEVQKVTNLLDFAISTLIQKFDPQNHGAWGQPGGGGGGSPRPKNRAGGPGVPAVHIGLVGDWGKGTGGPGVAGEPSGPRVAGGPGVPGGPGGASGPGVPGMPGGPCGHVGPPVPRFLPVGAVVQVGAVVGQLRRVCQVGQVGLVGR